MNRYQVCIQDKHTDDDGLRVEIPLDPHDYWANLQAGKCPDCGHQWVWAEAGWVPGTRQCQDCGSLYTVLGARYDEDDGKSAQARKVAVLRRERLY